MVIARAAANSKKGKMRWAADWALTKNALLSGLANVHCSGEMWYDTNTNSYFIKVFKRRAFEPILLILPILFFYPAHLVLFYYYHDF